MTSRLTHTLKNQLFVYLVVAALAIATPEFAGRAEAQDDSGFYFMMEGRYAISIGDETPYAEVCTFGCTTAINVEDIDTDDGGGGRIGGAYRTGRWDFGIFYSGLHVSGEKDSSVPVPTYLYPVLGAAYNGYTTAFSEAEATYHILDFEAGYNMKLGQADVRLFGGLRYANFDQDVNTTFSSSAYNVVEKRDVDFSGIGFRLGANAHKPLSGPWGVAGAISGGLLFGDQDTLTTQHQTAGNTVIGDTQVSRRRDSRAAGFVDGELGVTYGKEMANASKLIFTFGYRVEAWFYVNNTQSEPPTVSGNIYGTMYTEQIFHGPFLRGEWRFK